MLSLRREARAARYARLQIPVLRLPLAGVRLTPPDAMAKGIITEGTPEAAELLKLCSDFIDKLQAIQKENHCAIGPIPCPQCVYGEALHLVGGLILSRSAARIEAIEECAKVLADRIVQVEAMKAMLRSRGLGDTTQTDFVLDELREQLAAIRLLAPHAQAGRK